MPKTPMDYSKCCIYKIEHIENDNLVYVGHTTNFNKRKGEHKSKCMNENDNAFNLKLYTMIREIGGWDMFKTIEVEKYECNDKREAERREDEIMKGLKANMNSHRASRTQKQYYEDNKDKLKEKTKEYREGNKDYCKEYNKQYREDNKGEKQECMKQYRDDNKDKI
jgi:hypothetical protein